MFSASCEISHERGVRFVSGIGFCILIYHTRDWGYDLLQALGSALQYDIVLLCKKQHVTGGTICTKLASASCVITHETGGTIDFGHWILHLVISHTRQGGV